MGISFGSINTGLPKDIVDQIMAAEKIPINKMEARKKNIDEKKKLVIELHDLVKNLQGNVAANGNARSLREFKVIANEEFVEVTVDKNVAEPGSYQFEVANLAQKSSAMSNGFEDPHETYVGVGFLQYFLPDGETKDIYIDEDSSSLKGIAKLINKDRGNGMRAVVVNDGSGSEAPWRIIISLQQTGDDNIAEFPFIYLVDGEEDLYLEFEREAHDALVKLDGFELEVPENKASELIPGVTIDLKKAKPGEEFTIQIVEDTQKIADKIESIIGGINEVLQFIITQNTLDENSDTQKTLGGDVTLQTIESRLRSIIFTPTDTEFGEKRIGDIGITFQRNGLLKFDRNKFEAKISKDFKEISQILTGRFDEDGVKIDGFIDRLKKSVQGFIGVPNGIILNRKNGIQSKIDQIDRQIVNKERLLTQKENNLKDKFARLEATISKIRSQGAGLAALGGGTIDPVTPLGQ